MIKASDLSKVGRSQGEAGEVFRPKKKKRLKEFGRALHPGK